MSRKKKTRNPGSIFIKPTAADKDSEVNKKDRKPKKFKGNAPGTKQLEGAQKKRSQPSAKVKKDPRIGSKKPILLVKESAEKTENKVTPNNNKVPDIAKVKVINSGPSIAEQISAIENDEKLQAILDKQEDGDLLTEAEVSYYNEMMDKHEELADQLDDEPESDVEAVNQESLSEDDLWDKLDGSDLSKFE